MYRKDFISIHDLSPATMDHLLEVALKVKASPEKYEDALVNHTMAMIFEKPSLRTRVSFEAGMTQLGGHAIYLGPNDISLGKRESVPDIARTLDRMVDLIMARTFSHESILQLAQFADIPVINGLSDLLHPCQAVADFQTILEKKGELKGLTLAFVGDGNNVAHSLMFAGAKTGVNVRVLCPEGFDPKPEMLALAREDARETGATMTVTHDLREGVSGADVIYTDVWASMGQEAEAEKRKAIFRPYQVNAALMAMAKEDAIFMHCLPAHRGEEVTDEVIESWQSVVFDEAENRLHAQKAIILSLMLEGDVE
ncbi:MAG: ornithine carbamoyltransferase [Acidobacteriota bacterium]